ncbi:hypothetical protein J7E88_23845 [Streptomyces sp. ISL-10]|uniref:hypothetical protein n=1 Tax=Streptomyces sp. ISL-10 TaxID=2819172 RepID=UPI001BEC2A8E|nr:hypothetical protein [Streptomyces sp. ISL-10]MBT2368273.1 hypothetical protein [Streptomyces sp. ISL-10]
MRRNILRGVAAALTVSALCFTAACGSGDDKKGGAKDSASEKPAEEKASTEPLTAAQMKAALTEVGDLPAGWTATKVPASDDAAPKADKPECQPLADVMGDEIKGATNGGSVDFKHKDGKTQLSQLVLTFPATGAADYIKGIDTALGSCTSLSVEMEGTKVPVKIKRIEGAPKVGEASQAFTMTLEIAPGIAINSNLVVAHQGTGATRVAFLNDGGAAAQKSFGDVVTRVGDKFVKGATS